MMEEEDLTLFDLESRERPPQVGQQQSDTALPRWYERVRHTALKDFTAEDLARACRQGLHLEHIVPFVLKILQQQPAAGDLYEGELLVALNRVDATYWVAHPVQSAALRNILTRSTLPEEILNEARDLAARLPKL